MSEEIPPVPPLPDPPSAAPVMSYETPGDIELNKDARLWGMFCHLSSLAGYFIPFGNIIGPLVVWMIKKDEYPFVNDQGKESLNWQITMMIAALISAALICVVIGIFMLIAVGIIDLIFIIIAAIKANEGKRYRYPFAIRFLS